MDHFHEKMSDSKVSIWKLFKKFNFSSFTLFTLTPFVCVSLSLSVWPDWVIYWTLDNFWKPLETINLPKSPTFNFCKGVKIFQFSSEIIFGQLLWTYGNFFLSHCSLSHAQTPTKCYHRSLPPTYLKAVWTQQARKQTNKITQMHARFTTPRYLSTAATWESVTSGQQTSCRCNDAIDIT